MPNLLLLTSLVPASFLTGPFTKGTGLYSNLIEEEHHSFIHSSTTSYPLTMAIFSLGLTLPPPPSLPPPVPPAAPDPPALVDGLHHVVEHHTPLGQAGQQRRHWRRHILHRRRCRRRQPPTGGGPHGGPGDEEGRRGVEEGQRGDEQEEAGGGSRTSCGCRHSDALTGDEAGQTRKRTRKSRRETCDEQEGEEEEGKWVCNVGGGSCLLVQHRARESKTCLALYWADLAWIRAMPLPLLMEEQRWAEGCETAPQKAEHGQLFQVQPMRNWAPPNASAPMGEAEGVLARGIKSHRVSIPFSFIGQCRRTW